MNRGLAPRWLRVAVVLPFVLLAVLRCAGVIFPLTWEWGMYDFAVRHLVPRAPATDRVVVIEIDNQTLSDIGERWPISRQTWAEFIQVLDSYDPAVIGLDVVFPEESDATCYTALAEVQESLERIPSPPPDPAPADPNAGPDATPGRQDPCQAMRAGIDRTTQLVDRHRTMQDPDALLRDAIARSGRVVLGEIRPTRDETLHSTRDLRSIPDIAAVARGHGVLNIYRDWDGVLRRYHYITEVDGAPRPSLALAVVLNADLAEAPDWMEHIRSVDRGAPLLRFTNRIDALRFSDVHQHHEANEAHLRELISGSIVLVGVTANGVQEQHPTPIESALPGVEIHAFAVMNLASQRHTTTLGAAAWCGLLITLLAFLAMFLAAERLSMLALGALVPGLWILHLGLMYLLLVQFGWLIGFIPVGVGVFAMALTELIFRVRALGEYRRLVAEQERLNEAKSEFIATISHELRTPLTSIRGSLGLVAGGAVGALPDQAGELIQIAHTNTERLIRLVNNFLDFQKIATGKMEYHFEVVELEPMIESTVTAMEGFGEQFEVRIVTHEIPQAWIEVDTDLFTQALTNLLSNAIKFSPHGEDVTVRTTLAGKYVRIEVVDRGPGIPEDFRHRIFTKFAQGADSTSSSRSKGSGLGLNIVKLIVDEHRGRVGFETEVGAGSTFFIELPVATPPAGASSARDSAGDDDADEPPATDRPSHPSNE